MNISKPVPAPTLAQRTSKLGALGEALKSLEIGEAIFLDAPITKKLKNNVRSRASYVTKKTNRHFSIRDVSNTDQPKILDLPGDPTICIARID